MIRLDLEIFLFFGVCILIKLCNVQATTSPKYIDGLDTERDSAQNLPQ